ncbi:MAG TPA: DUF5103 domain-containing protein [Bacteroidales bacterium]
MSFAKNLLTVLLLFTCLEFCSALPQGPFPDAVFSKNIKTVQFYKEGWEFSYPIVDLNDNKPLLLSFDELESGPKNLNYIIVLCDADWMPSRLSYSEYLDGFYQNTIPSYQVSFNTHIPYTHYSLKVPNENAKVKLPGNYIVLVYEDNEDNPLLIKRFVAVDQKISIEANIKRPTIPKFQNNYQEVDFSLLYPDYPLENPYQTVKVVVVKNNQWKFSITDLKPLFLKTNELDYNYEDKNLFPGGNEYRSFDIKSIKYQSANIQSIVLGNDTWVVTLKPDKPRDKVSYLSNEDLNGKYLIQNQEGTNPDNDAEYAHVIFRFPMETPLPDGDIYVYGGFSDYNCYDDYKMTYNTEHNAYELNMLVKQGYYNYQYVYLPRNSNDVDERYFEGSHYETENDYVFYVYYRPFGSRYDKLIGVQVANSLKK